MILDEKAIFLSTGILHVVKGIAKLKNKLRSFSVMFYNFIRSEF